MKIIVSEFDLKSTILSGQAFRVFEKEDSFDIILKDRVINVKQIDNTLILSSNNMDNLKPIIEEYFDLNRDYKSINHNLSKDSIMKECIKKCYGYKILNQDKFEIIISYIISQNNNVKRISSSINKISESYGTKVVFNNSEYYLFPTYEQIKDITIEELREFGVGFRDKYIKNYLDNYYKISAIDNLNTKDAMEELMKIKGIGLKVASCILLFGYKRFDVFPIDTWVKKFMVDNYKIKDDQKIIKEFACERFGKYSGLAIQYMFHSKRNIDI